MQILLVEDDSSLAKGLQRALRDEGFSINHVAQGALAIHVVKTDPPDIVILDLGLPDIDGLEVLRYIRQQPQPISVLILTARAGLDDKIKGLDLGADDYLAKPFDTRELLARLRVLERRISGAATHTLSVGDIEMDTSSHVVKKDGAPIETSRREYMLLKALMENLGKIQTRETLESKLYDWGEEVASNAIEVHIHNLRKKLGPALIKTVRGVGYTIQAP